MTSIWDTNILARWLGALLVLAGTPILIVSAIDRARLPVLVAILVLPVLLAIAIRLPGAVFAAYIHIPFYKAAVDPLSPVDITPLLAVFCLMLALPLFQYGWREWPQTVRSAFILWSLLLILVVCGSLVGEDVHHAANQVVNFLALVYLPLLLGLRVAWDGRLRRQFMLAVLALYSSIIMLVIVNLGSLGEFDRASPLGINPIDTGRAGIMLPLIVPSIWLVLPKILRLPVLILIPAGVFVAVASGSRGPLLMSVVSFLFVYIFVSRRRLRSILIGSAILAASLAILQHPYVANRIPTQSLWRITALRDALLSSETQELDTSSRSRLELWDMAQSIFMQNPLVGAGTGGFESAMSRLQGFEVYNSPHNLFLHFAADFGILGVALFMSMLVVAIRRGVKTQPDPIGLAFLLLGVFAIANSLVGIGLYEGRWFWGILIVLMALPPNDDCVLSEKWAEKEVNDGWNSER